MFSHDQKVEFPTFISKFEKKIYSQNGEDGVIENIFNDIGFTNKKFIEFGFHFNECNSRYLIEKYDFSGLFIDSNIPIPGEKHKIDNLFFHKEWITKDNINNIIEQYFKGDIDFLSIDIDGIDLYVLDSINVINPRVICVEICASIGNELSVTVAYDEKFDRHDKHPSGFYCGGSLKATINVMKKKGYKFVGCVAGLNAFFVRNDCKLKNFKELTCKEGWNPHLTRTFQKQKRWDGTTRALTQDEQFNWIKRLKWIEVTDDGIITDKVFKITW